MKTITACLSIGVLAASVSATSLASETNHVNCAALIQQKKSELLRKSDSGTVGSYSTTQAEPEFLAKLASVTATGPAENEENLATQLAAVELMGDLQSAPATATVLKYLNSSLYQSSDMYIFSGATSTHVMWKGKDFHCKRCVNHLKEFYPAFGSLLKIGKAALPVLKQTLADPTQKSEGKLKLALALVVIDPDEGGVFVREVATKESNAKLKARYSRIAEGHVKIDEFVEWLMEE